MTGIDSQAGDGLETAIADAKNALRDFRPTYDAAFPEDDSLDKCLGLLEALGTNSIDNQRFYAEIAPVADRLSSPLVSATFEGVEKWQKFEKALETLGEKMASAQLDNLINFLSGSAQEIEESCRRMEQKMAENQRRFDETLREVEQNRRPPSNRPVLH